MRMDVKFYRCTCSCVQILALLLKISISGDWKQEGEKMLKNEKY
jgi:hypothetical protein